MPRRVTSTSGNSGIGAYCLFAYDLPFWQALRVIVEYTFSGRRGGSYFRRKINVPHQAPRATHRIVS